MIYLDDIPIKLCLFPDGTLNLTDASFIPHNSVIKITWKFNSLMEQVQLYHLTNFLKDIYPEHKLNLYLPYCLDARMDRVKNPQYEVHTLKYFCKFINDLGFNNVYVEDVHSSVTMALLDRAIDMRIDKRINRLVERELQPDYLYFPDKGAYERYEYLRIRTSFFGEKDRDWVTGEIRGVIVHNPYNIVEAAYKNRSILIIDDISSYGGTFHHSANKLKEMGFGTIYLYITHCENSILQGDAINNPNIKHIYTTNSIFTGEHEKITVLE